MERPIENLFGESVGGSHFAEEHGFGEDQCVVSHVSASTALGGIPDASDITS
jgi:hypothetical protein